MKILIVSSLYFPYIKGGGEISTKLLAEGLNAKGFDVKVYSISNKEKDDIINGVHVHRVKTSNIYWSFNAPSSKLKKIIWHLKDSYNIQSGNKFKEYISKNKPDVVITSTIEDISPYIWKICKELKIKVIHILRSYTLLCPKATMYKKDKLCKKQCLSCKIITYPKKILSKYVDVVVGISEFILNEHTKYGYFPNAKQEVIYNPVEIPKIKIQKYNKNKKEMIFGFVGRIEKAKGIEFLLDNFSRLKLENVKLFIYGKGLTKEYENEIKQKYESNQIIFKGFKKPEEIYNEIDILIVPSLWNEPFGRIVPEANSYEVPVLVSNRGGLPELVEEGKNGYVFDPDKEGDFEEKLKKIIEMKKNNSFSFDKEKFSLDEVIKKYEQILYL